LVFAAIANQQQGKPQVNEQTSKGKKRKKLL